MTPNIQYVVTKPSDDGTFGLGNHIKFLSDGAVLCIEAKGWIDVDDVPEATKGMEYKVDEDWAERGRESARKLLAVLDNIGVD